MNVSLAYETTVFLSVAVLGISEGILFDIFRVVRRKVSKSFLCVSITDVLYWIFAGSLFAAAMFYITCGELRGYMFAGMILGLILYFLLLSNTIVSIITGIFSLFLKIFEIFFKILLTPTHFLYKMVLMPGTFFLKKIGNGVGKTISILKSGKKNDNEKK